MQGEMQRCIGIVWYSTIGERGLTRPLLGANKTQSRNLATFGGPVTMLQKRYCVEVLQGGYDLEYPFQLLWIEGPRGKE